MIVKRYITTSTSTIDGPNNNNNNNNRQQLLANGFFQRRSSTSSSAKLLSLSSDLFTASGHPRRSDDQQSSCETEIQSTIELNKKRNEEKNMTSGQSLVPFGANVGASTAGTATATRTTRTVRRSLAPVQRQSTLFDGTHTIDEEPFFSADVRSLAKEIGMDFEELEQHALGIKHRSMHHQRTHQAHFSSSSSSLSSRRQTSSSSSSSSTTSRSSSSSSTSVRNTTESSTANQLLQARRTGTDLRLNINNHHQFRTPLGSLSASLLPPTHTATTSGATSAQLAASEPIIDEPKSSISSTPPPLLLGQSRLITLQYENDNDTNSNTKNTTNQHQSSMRSQASLMMSGGANNNHRTIEPMTIVEQISSADEAPSSVPTSSALINANGAQSTANKPPAGARGGGDTPTPANKSASVMSRSIDRIEEHMTEVTGKLVKSFDARDLKEVVGLLNVMIRMLEKAWSVPSCGYDLGFKLCNSVRLDNGLRAILDYLLDLPSPVSSPGPQSPPLVNGPTTTSTTAPILVNSSDDDPHNRRRCSGDPSEPIASLASLDPQLKTKEQTKEDLEDGVSSDDSSCTLTGAAAGAAAPANSAHSTCSSSSGVMSANASIDCDDNASNSNDKEMSELHEQVVLLCARLLSQCLTADNRDYIVANGLQLVVKLACRMATAKSPTAAAASASKQQSIVNSNTDQQVNQSSNGQTTEQEEEEEEEINRGDKQQQLGLNWQQEQEQQLHQQARIGTEMLQHLFKHSEETCTDIIGLGGLGAILYECRSTDCVTLRHCASALANLAMYGGADAQQTMIEEKAHVWLFPLAFNSDDNVQYYACLAIAVLVANQEIEADVLKSSTLDLVEPFVTTHEPQKFACSSTSHIHGQSAPWLSKLLPLLDSKRVEARNLAAFHFAMEAYIKKAQGQTDVFRSINAIQPLQRVASSPIAIESKFACQALRLCGEPVPHRLSQQVPLWQVDDVVAWVKQIGFEKCAQQFVDSQVDGDLLLRIDERALAEDLGVGNGLRRRRFLRELQHLKRIADYTSCDPTNVYSILAPLGPDFVQYLYPMVTHGVTADSVHQLTDVQLANECCVVNSVHRMKLEAALAGLGERLASAKANAELDGSVPTKTLDVFVSYRRSTGSQLASLLKVHLQLRGFSVFIDVERLEAGKFDNNLLESIKMAKNFILVLTPHALDRCEGDDDCKDWVHKEIVQALASDCNIIPIFDNFQWPDPDALPADMRSILYFNGVRWIHDYQDACVDKVERFIRGELANNQPSIGSSSGHLAGAQSLVSTPVVNCVSSSVSSTPSPSHHSSSSSSVISNNSSNNNNTSNNTNNNNNTANTSLNTANVSPFVHLSNMNGMSRYSEASELHPLASVFRLR